ncbi:MAG: radical SAM protein [SAR202 cluster bacterium]|nr:radical SAM protein [SAR202 cluster bacterium]
MTLNFPDIQSGLTVERNGVWSPELVSWNTTNRCNLRCDHCYLSAGDQGKDELSLDEGRRLIDEMFAAGTRMLILTGGEPLMRRDIVDLASHASGKGMVVVFGTNGMLLSPRTVRELKDAGISGVGISLDSLKPELHDDFRGVPGAWEGAVRGIRTCVTEGLPVLLQMTVLPWNREELDAMIEFAHAERVTGFTLYFLVCTGRGEELSDITPAQYDEALETAVEAQDRYPDMMVRARCAPQISRVAAGINSALLANAGCMAARQYVRVTPEGRVTPCPYLPLQAGDVRTESFGDIWREAPVLRSMREQSPGGRCGECEYGKVCGGCRARAHALSDDLFAEDIWCLYEPKGDGAAAPEIDVSWTPEAEQRLQRIPGFIRGRVRGAVEAQARSSDTPVITPDVLKSTLDGIGRRIPFKRPGQV